MSPTSCTWSCRVEGDVIVDHGWSMLSDINDDRVVQCVTAPNP